MSQERLKSELDGWWNRWTVLTRVLHGYSLAARLEATRLQSLPFVDRSGRLKWSTVGSGEFECTVTDLENVLANQVLLHEHVLLMSCARIEALGRILLLALEQDCPEDSPLGKIEDWGSGLLESLGQTWEMAGGKAAVVEPYIVRNAVAHGIVVTNERMLNRVTDVKGQFPWKLGEPIVLDSMRLVDYRANLKRFARVIAGDKVRAHFGLPPYKD